jgi:hypothetical protein
MIITDKCNNDITIVLLKYISETEIKTIDTLVKQAKFADLITIFNKEYINKFENLYARQIILSILIFALLKLQQHDQVKNLIGYYNISFDNSIFSYKFLEGKYLYLTV